MLSLLARVRMGCECDVFFFFITYNRFSMTPSFQLHSTSCWGYNTGLKGMLSAPLFYLWQSGVSGKQTKPDKTEGHCL